MAFAPGSSLAEADLHGLVDGHIEIDRRAEALRRLAASPADRARVEAWQGQNDLLRSAFAPATREPLPALLDLKAKPPLACIPANEAPLLGPALSHRRPPRRGRLGMIVAAIALIATAGSAVWIMLDTTTDDEDMIAGAKLRGTVDAAIASRSAEAVAAAPTALHRVTRPGDSLPTTDIPDLRPAGFAFAGAETDASMPPSILFRYQNARAERIVVSVARAATQDASPTPIAQIGNTFSWHKRDNAYAIAGTLRPNRLRAIAVSLMSADDSQ